MFKIIRYLFELFIFIFFFSIFSLLPLNLSRKCGIFLSVNLGRYTSTNKIIKKNLGIAFPSKSQDWLERTTKDVWINFGKVVGEYSHIKELANKKNQKIKIIENSYSESFFNNSNKKILISSHNANWEVPGIACKIKSNSISGIVREPNNPFIKFFLSRIRSKYSVKCYEKNMLGTKMLIKDFNNGNSIALLADQQITTGLEVSFFGKLVKSTKLPAQLALKSKSDIYLAWPRRHGDDFEFEFYQPIKSSLLENNEHNIQKIVNQINEFFERQISISPSEYFWHHNRWK